MKLLVPFDLEEKYKNIGRDIIGEENIIWFPEDGKAEVVLVRGNDFPRDRNFKLIQTVSAGTDHIDTGSIPENTLIASNAGAYSISVAEHAFALLLERAKKISTFEQETKKGIFKPRTTNLLFGKTIGIVGYGGIGSRVAAIAKSFGMRVVAIGRGFRDTHLDEFLEIEKLDKLLEASDVILISIPLTNRTIGMIGEHQLNLVKKECVIINVARPEILIEEELLDFLKKNKMASYLTDVWWGEPRLDSSNLENIVVTPHVAGGLSGEVMELAFGSAFENIKRYMDGKEPRNLVKREESLFFDRVKIGI